MNKKFFLLLALAVCSLTVCAQKMPKGRLLSYYHNITNPEIPYSFRLELTCDEDGKGKLRVGNDQPVMVDGEVIDSWVAFFKEKKLQAIDKK